MGQMHPELFTYYNLRRRTSSPDIDLLFPGWQSGNERVVVLSPHDDDGVLGAGYLMLAALANGAQVYLVVFCDGWAGYSTPAEKASILARRRRETVEAYRLLGLDEEHILRFDYPDFSAWSWLGWSLPGGQTGLMARFIPAMRRIAPTRLLLPNGHREHQDHEAVYRVGAYDGPQVGDAIVADLGQAAPIQSFLQYSVWADFDPQDALVAGSAPNLRANCAVRAPRDVEDVIASSIHQFESQSAIIEGILRHRIASRCRGDYGLELFLSFDPRPVLDYTPYHELIRALR